MTLKEWLGVRAYDINEGDTADIFAQLFNCLDRTESICLDPSDISLTDDGGLVYTPSGGFDDIYRPVKATGDRADAVFAAGIMLYHKMSGELPDMANAGLLLLGAQSDENISLCSYPASSADELITAMTRIRTERRVTASQSLDMLAKLYTSKAEIVFREEQTGVVLCTKEIPLSDGYTEYKPRASETGAAGVFPVTERITIPYRRKVCSYTCIVSAVKDMPEEHRTRKTHGRIFGFDAGISHLTAALFDTDGRLYDIPVPDDSDISSAVSHILESYGYDRNTDIIAATDRSGISADTSVDMCDALEVYTSSERPSLTAYLGSTAYIYVTGSDGEKGSSSAELGSRMSGVLEDDIRAQLRIKHHIDLSDEVLHKDSLMQTKKAAVSIMKKLSYSETAEHQLTIRYDGEGRTITLLYDRYSFESLVRGILSDLRSALSEALSGARTGRQEIVNITLTGGAACMPCLEDIFVTNGTAKVSYLHERISARGAAVCADTPEKKAASLEYDIGILNIPVNSNMPIFETLIKAGTPYGQCKAIYSSERAKRETVDGRDVYCLKLYSRKKDMEHVKTPYDPEGSAISFIGRYAAVIPSGFSAGNDRIISEITAEDDSICVNAYHERRRNMLSKLFGIGDGEWERIGTVKVI